MLAVGLAGCRTYESRPGGEIRLGGAQIPVELVQNWLRAAKSHGFATTQVAPVYLSQHGFENLARGECDLACADRIITPRELGDFAGRELRGCRVAFYGYALYVHPDNPLDAIFARHMKMVFEKRITDWHELAGDELPQCQGPIKLYGPQKGTRAGQVLAPLARIWFANATWTELETDADIIAAVAADPLALGFASIGYDEGVRYLGLRMERRGRPAFPSLEEIESERYGLAKVIYLFYLAPPSPVVQAVLDYLWSAEGSAAIEATDVWPIQPERAALPPLQ